MDAAQEDLLHGAWKQAAARALPVTVMDLSRLAFGDSALLNSLLQARAAHQAYGRTLILADPVTDLVQRLFTLTGTTQQFVFAPSVQQALPHEDKTR